MQWKRGNRRERIGGGGKGRGQGGKEKILKETKEEYIQYDKEKRR